MLIKNAHLKLALALAITTLGQLACNNTKAEQLEEEQSDEAEGDGAPNRDNRSIQSGDAAFIKIFPDGDLVTARTETTTPAASSSEAAPATAAAPSTDAAETHASTPAASTPATAEESAAPAHSSQPASPATAEETPAPAAETPPAATQPVAETQAPAPEANTVNEPAPAPAAQEPAPAAAPAAQEPAPAPAPVIVQAPAPAPAPVIVQAPSPADEPSPSKDMEDPSRPTLALNESTASQLITIQPKENKATVTIGKHSDFADGPYMVFAKWTDDSKKVKVQVSGTNSDKDCKIDESATQGEWKTLGVFYLTKNAKVVITNKKNSSFAVKNELLLKPVIAEHLTKPSKFKCLDGQIDGQGLVGYQ